MQNIIWASVHATINTGNYQNVKVEIGCSQSIPPTITAKEKAKWEEELYDGLYATLLDHIKEVKEDFTNGR